MPLTRIMTNWYMAIPANETIMSEMAILSQNGSPMLFIKLQVINPVTTYKAPCAKFGSLLMP